MSWCGKIILKKPTLHCLSGLLTVFFILALTNMGRAQNAVLPDTSVLGARDTLIGIQDTVAASGAADTSAIASLEDSLGIKISKEGLSAIVTATATDSAVLDMRQNLFYLYGDAQVNYEDLKLNAGAGHLQPADKHHHSPALV